MKEIYTLADLRNWDRIDDASDVPIRLGVFGDPVAHSLSPQMQNAALENCGIEMQYARFEISAGELEEALAFLPRLNFVGVNLTVPHKMAALSFLDEADENARAIGAVNTVVVKNGRLHGCNTDGAGFSDAITSGIFGNVSLSQLPVLILGAGGAARAIARECVRQGCPKVSLSNRTYHAAKTLCDELMKMGGRTEIEMVAQDASSFGHAVAKARLIVNATSAGLRPNERSLIPRDWLNESHLVYDTIYNPPRTSLLMEAEAAGAKFANGITMLLYQGARSFELWFDRKAPIEVMRTALHL